VTLNVSRDGAVHVQSQVMDYSRRGESLADYNLLHFFSDTYNAKKTVNYREVAEDISEHVRRGRPPHERVPYLPSHPRSHPRQRIVRPAGHNKAYFVARFPFMDSSGSVKDVAGSFLAGGTGGGST
jgi:hypothetical protein